MYIDRRIKTKKNGKYEINKDIHYMTSIIEEDSTGPHIYGQKLVTISCGHIR